MGKHLVCLPIRIFLLCVFLVKEHSRLKHLFLMAKDFCDIVGYFDLDSSLDDEGLHINGNENVLFICSCSRYSYLYSFLLCGSRFSHNSLLKII